MSDYGIQTLRHQRKELVTKLETMFKNDAGELDFEGDWDGERQKEYDSYMAQVKKIDADIERREEVLNVQGAAVEKNVIATEADKLNITLDNAENRFQAQSMVWHRNLLEPIAASNQLGGEDVTKRLKEMNTDIERRFRADVHGGTSGGSAGSNLIPTLVSDMIVERVASFQGPRKYANVVVMNSGNPIDFPTEDDTSNEGARRAPGSSSAEQDPEDFGKVTIEFDQHNSGVIGVDKNLIADAQTSYLVPFLTGLQAKRLYRRESKAQTVNQTGYKTRGVVSVATSGVTAAAATEVTFGELVSLKHSIDPAYRNINDQANVPGAHQRTGMCMFATNDASISELEKETVGTSDARPVFLPSWRDGQPERLLGYPLVQFPYIPAMATGAFSWLFGDLMAAYLILQHGGVDAEVYTDSVYASKRQIGLNCWLRTGANVIDANAIRKMTMG